MTTLVSIEARICPESSSLCMRIQNVVSVGRPNAAQLSSGTRFLEICGRISARPEYDPKLLNLVKYHVDAYLSGSVSNSGLERCRTCGTDYKIEVKEYGDDGLALVITKWIDLGSGITPDSRWDTDFLCYRDTDLGAPELLGDARRRFEKAPAGESEEELLCRNFSNLSGEKYKAAMDQLNDSTWFLQAESRLPRCISRTLANLGQTLFFLATWFLMDMIIKGIRPWPLHLARTITLVAYVVFRHYCR